MVAGMNPAVHLGGVTVERSGQTVVHGVDLTVARGSWFGLIGANGSGKTSLLRALAGRLPFAGGSCRMDGKEMATDRAARAMRFGFSPPADKLPNALRARDVLELFGGNMDDIRSHLGSLHDALGLMRRCSGLPPEILKLLNDERSISCGPDQRRSSGLTCASRQPP